MVEATVTVAVAADTEAPLLPSPPSSPLPGRVLRFLALRLGDAVVYALCAAVFLLSAGTVLSVLAGRVGGALLTDAARFVVLAGACLFPSGVVGIPLLAWRAGAAQAAKRRSGNEAPATPRRDESRKKGSILRDHWAGTPKSWQVFFMFGLLVFAGQVILLFSPLEGSFVEKLASLLSDAGLIGTALVNGFWFAPSMAMEWWAAQRTLSAVSLKKELPV